MKYLFIPKDNGTHIRTSDKVRGNLLSFSEKAKVISPHPVLDSATGIETFVAAPVSVLKTLTKRELVDKLIAAGIAAQFNALLGELPLEEKLRWEASPTIAPDYPFIRDNRAYICNELGITSEQLDNLFR